MRALPLACAATLFALAACQGREEAPASTDAAPAPDAAGSTFDPSGAAPPQPNPNGGETPVGATGSPGGASPSAGEAVNQGDPATPGTTAPPQ